MGRFLFLFLLGGLFLSACGPAPDTTSKKMYFGFYQFNLDALPDPVRLKSPLVLTPHVMSWSLDFEKPFPVAQCVAFHKLGIVPLIRWEPWSWQNRDLVRPEDILAGKWDAYLQTWADSLRMLDQQVLIAFAPDFNSKLYPWSISNNGKNPENYRALYRYVVSFFREAGVSNVVWVWNYLAISTPLEEWNSPTLAYPGDDAVGWLAISAVNQKDALVPMFQEAVSDVNERYHKPLMLVGYFYDATRDTDDQLLAAFNGPLLRVNAVIFSNTDMLPNRKNAGYPTLFDGDMAAFSSLQFGL